MPGPANPIYKSVRIKKETTAGTAAGQAGAQVLRRTNSTLKLVKQTYESQERRDDLQKVDMRHGVRSVEGGISGELSPLTYESLLVAALRKAWAGVTAMTGLTVTVGAPTNGVYPFSRSAGSWLTDGVKVGMVIRPTAGLNVANRINLLVVDIASATAASVMPLNGATLTQESAVAATSISVPGKVSFVPSTGHTDDSFSIEEWHNDASISRLFLGCKVKSIAINLPPTGMATFEAQIAGLDEADNTNNKRGGVALTAQYFTSPTAQTTTGLLAAVNGVVRYGAGSVAVITGLNFTMEGEQEPSGPVVGSNIHPSINAGEATVSGSFTVLFQDRTFLDAFQSETEASITGAFTTNNTGTAEFLGFTLSRIKLNSFDASEGNTNITCTVQFVALKNINGGAGTKDELTTILVQDSLAP